MDIGEFIFLFFYDVVSCMLVCLFDSVEALQPGQQFSVRMDPTLPDLTSANGSKMSCS